jgi:hypothetical protein
MGRPTHHIAAQFEDLAAARAAEEALIAAGVAEKCILVLDRGHAAIPAESNTGLWGSLKSKFVPDRHAHPYAEGVARGHPLVVADVVDPDLAARASAALAAAHPINIESRASEWVDDGWDGVHDGQSYWLSAQDLPDAAGSGGITAGGIISGDYGSVGGLHGGGRVDTDITRGMGVTRPMESGEAVVVNDDPTVRVYQVG